MTVAFHYFNAFQTDLGLKKHNLNSDTLKIALSNTLPDAANAVLADITQISATHGYSAGGSVIPNNAFTGSGGTATLVGDQVVFTASGGSIGPFQYAVVYNSTASGGPLIGWFDYGSPLTLLDTGTLTIQENSLTTGGGILTVSHP